MRAIMVEQLGLAMIPPCPYRMPFMASAFTSGMTNGTPSVILKAELLSTTCSNDTPAFHTHYSPIFDYHYNKYNSNANNDNDYTC